MVWEGIELWQWYVSYIQMYTDDILQLYNMVEGEFALDLQASVLLCLPQHRG